MALLLGRVPGHGRIVLECPEYGKATYFFEIEAGVPLKLQVRRLLAVMGAAAVGRADVFNNRPLLVHPQHAPRNACLGMGFAAAPCQNLLCHGGAQYRVV